MGSDADAKMEIVIGNMLRIGVSVAATIALLGWILYLLQAHGARPDYGHFHGQSFGKLSSIFRGAVSFNSRSIIETGILLLVATPIVRVIFCIASFLVQKDRLYVLVSSIVLAILLFSLFFHA